MGLAGPPTSKAAKRYPPTASLTLALTPALTLTLILTLTLTRYPPTAKKEEAATLYAILSQARLTLALALALTLALTPTLTLALTLTLRHPLAVRSPRRAFGRGRQWRPGWRGG